MIYAAREDEASAARDKLIRMSLARRRSTGDVTVQVHIISLVKIRPMSHITVLIAILNDFRFIEFISRAGEVGDLTCDVGGRQRRHLGK